MIKLPNVTLFGIDCFKPKLAIMAMERSRHHVQFAETVLLTDTSKHALGSVKGFRIVHHAERDIRVSLPRATHYKVPLDYELASLCEPSRHVLTSHLLYVEWDAGVLNAYAWDDSWLEYDFIGAPWPPHYEPGWPLCDGHTNSVGNFGFSLRSVKFCDLTRKAVEKFKDHPEHGPQMVVSDMFACRAIRWWLEEQGVKFAPDNVAARFSCENRVYAGEFGYHGQWTAELNNWGGPLAHIRPKY